MSHKNNKHSPWRKHMGGLGPLSLKKYMERLDLDRDNSNPIPGVLDIEFTESPSRLTEKELEELL